MQHAIQEVEDFARGGSSDGEFTDRVKDAVKDIADGKLREIQDWKEINQYEIIAKDNASESFHYALMYDSSITLLKHACRDKPSSVFRH